MSGLEKDELNEELKTICDIQLQGRPCMNRFNSTSSGYPSSVSSPSSSSTGSSGDFYHRFVFPSVTNPGYPVVSTPTTSEEFTQYMNVEVLIGFQRRANQCCCCYLQEFFKEKEQQAIGEQQQREKLMQQIGMKEKSWSSIVWYGGRDILDLGSNLKGNGRNFVNIPVVPCGSNPYFENRSQLSRLHGEYPPAYRVGSCHYCRHD